MGWFKQLRNFTRALLFGAPQPGRRYVDPLAKTASDLRIVNMSVEDDRLESSAMNTAYVKSLED